MFVQQWIFLLLSALMKHFQFLIKFGTWNATLLLHEKHTLTDLAQAILKAVKFELDHCFLPNSDALSIVTLITHEMVGYVTYKLKGYL